MAALPGWLAENTLYRSEAVYRRANRASQRAEPSLAAPSHRSNGRLIATGASSISVIRIIIVNGTVITVYIIMVVGYNTAIIYYLVSTGGCFFDGASYSHSPNGLLLSAYETMYWATITADAVMRPITGLIGQPTDRIPAGRSDD